MAFPARVKVPMNLGGRSQKEVDEEIFRKPGLTAEQKDISEWVPEVRAEDALPAQPLLLNFAQRANAVAVCGCLSLAFGKGTLDALETGLLPRDVAEVCTSPLLVVPRHNLRSFNVDNFRSESEVPLVQPKRICECRGKFFSVLFAVPHKSTK